MQYHPLLSSPSFDSPFSSCFSWLGPRNSPSPLRPPHCALSHSHPQSLLSQTSRFATQRPVLLPNSEEGFLISHRAFSLFWGQKEDFSSFFPRWCLQIPFLLFLLFFCLPLPASLTFTLNSSNFHLHSLLTEDLSLLACFSLSHLTQT